MATNLSRHDYEEDKSVDDSLRKQLQSLLNNLDYLQEKRGASSNRASHSRVVDLGAAGDASSAGHRPKKVMKPHSSDDGTDSEGSEIAIPHHYRPKWCRSKRCGKRRRRLAARAVEIKKPPLSDDPILDTPGIWSSKDRSRLYMYQRNASSQAEASEEATCMGESSLQRAKPMESLTGCQGGSSLADREIAACSVQRSQVSASFQGSTFYSTNPNVAASSQSNPVSSVQMGLLSSAEDSLAKALNCAANSQPLGQSSVSNAAVTFEICPPRGYSEDILSNLVQSVTNYVQESFGASVKENPILYESNSNHHHRGTPFPMVSQMLYQSREGLLPTDQNAHTCRDGGLAPLYERYLQSWQRDPWTNGLIPQTLTQINHSQEFVNPVISPPILPTSEEMLSSVAKHILLQDMYAGGRSINEITIESFQPTFTFDNQSFSSNNSIELGLASLRLDASQTFEERSVRAPYSTESLKERPLQPPNSDSFQEIPLRAHNMTDSCHGRFVQASATTESFERRPVRARHMTESFQERPVQPLNTHDLCQERSVKTPNTTESFQERLMRALKTTELRQEISVQTPNTATESIQEKLVRAVNTTESIQGRPVQPPNTTELFLEGSLQQLNPLTSIYAEVRPSSPWHSNNPKSLQLENGPIFKGVPKEDVALRDSSTLKPVEQTNKKRRADKVSATLSSTNSGKETTPVSKENGFLYTPLDFPELPVRSYHAYLDQGDHQNATARPPSENDVAMSVYRQAENTITRDLMHQNQNRDAELSVVAQLERRQMSQHVDASTIQNHSLYPTEDELVRFQSRPIQVIERLWDRRMLGLENTNYLLDHHVKRRLPTNVLPRLSEEVFFYMFYHHCGDLTQLESSERLYMNGWRFHKGYMRWMKHYTPPIPDCNAFLQNPASILTYINDRNFLMFNPETWKVEIFAEMVDANYFEGRPKVPLRSTLSSKPRL